MVELTRDSYQKILAHCLEGYPLEACGLLIGRGNRVTEIHPTENEARSARLYSIPPGDVLRAERRSEEMGSKLLGVFHSHTNSEAYPSPTDVRLAPDPSWIYLVVSLSRTLAELRAFRILFGKVAEDRVSIVGAGRAG